MSNESLLNVNLNLNLMLTFLWGIAPNCYGYHQRGCIRYHNIPFKRQSTIYYPCPSGHKSKTFRAFWDRLIYLAQKASSKTYIPGVNVKLHLKKNKFRLKSWEKCSGPVRLAFKAAAILSIKIRLSHFIDPKVFL